MPRERRRDGNTQRCTKGSTAVTVLPPAEHLRTIDAGKHVSPARARDSNKETATSHLKSPSPLLLQGARPGRPAAASERLPPPSSRPALFALGKFSHSPNIASLGRFWQSGGRYGTAVAGPGVARVPSRGRAIFRVGVRLIWGFGPCGQAVYVIRKPPAAPQRRATLGHVRLDCSVTDARMRSRFDFR